MTKAPNCIGFSPLADSECTHLILGSMPSVASLKAGEYYAHPQNRFWPLMAAILTGETAPADYEARKAMLLRHHVALWDAISACCRDGSLDSAISEEQGNDFAAFLPQYPKIKTICFNGAKSAQCFKKYNRALLERDDLRFFAMPSTSPANAAWSFARLLGKWGEAWE